MRRSKSRNLRIAGALIAVGALGALTACTPSTSEPAEESATGTVVIAVRAHFEEAMNQMIVDYKSANPDDEHTYEVQTIPDDNGGLITRLSTANLGGTMPDILQTGNSVSNLLDDKGITADLSDFLAEGPLTQDQFLPNFLGEYIPPGSDRVTGLPVSADATVLVYNERLFDEAGVDYPTEDWTWDDMAEAAKAITAAGNGSYYGLSLGAPWEAIYGPLIEINGATLYDQETNTTEIGSPEAIDAWESYLSLYSNGASTSLEVGGAPSAPQFESGTVAMKIAVRALVPTYRAQLTDPWSVVQMPTVDGERVVGGGSYGLAITQASKYPQASWDFLSWFFSVDGGTTLLQETYGSVPPTQDGLDEGVWLSLPGPPSDPQVFADAARSALITNVGATVPGSGATIINQAIIDAYTKVLLQGMSVEEAFTAAEKLANDQLAAQ